MIQRWSYCCKIKHWKLISKPIIIIIIDLVNTYTFNTHPLTQVLHFTISLQPGIGPGCFMEREVPTTGLPVDWHSKTNYDESTMRKIFCTNSHKCANHKRSFIMINFSGTAKILTSKSKMKFIFIMATVELQYNHDILVHRTGLKQGCQ